MQPPNPREVLELANEIVKLEDQLAALKGRWDSLFNAENLPKRVGGRPPRENSVPTQVLNVINSNPSLTWNAEKLAEFLEVDRDSVSSALYNLYAAEKIARHSRGLYMALVGVGSLIEPQAEKEREAA